MARLLRLSGLIDALNERIGRAVCWLAPGMMITQIVVVAMRYVFGAGSIWLQESVVYMHASLFMLAAGYTLLHDGHVRVDIFYRTAAPRRRALVDLLGTLLLLLPMCAVILIYSTGYVAQSWRVLESSRETSGIPAVFMLKSLIPIFAVLLALQGAASAVRALAVLRGGGGTGGPARPASARP